MANILKEELVEILKKLSLGLSQNVKTYVDGKNNEIVSQLSALVEQVTNNTNRLTLLDKIDDEDGINTLVERYNALEELLSKDGKVQDVLQAVNDINSRVDGLATRLTTAEQNITDLQTATANNKAVSDKNIQDIAKLSKTVADNKTETDERLNKVESDIEAITGGATGSIKDLNARVTANENAINDVTDKDGNVTKGLKTKVADLEKSVPQAIATANAYTNENALSQSHLTDIKENEMCGIINVSAEVFGLATTDCSSSSGDDNAL